MTHQGSVVEATILMNLPLDLYMVRHAEFITREDREKMNLIKQGATVSQLHLDQGVPLDKGLTAFGKEQVRSIAEWFTTHPELYDGCGGIEYWLCEPNPSNIRTHVTAAELNFSHVQWKYSPYLKDREWGSLGRCITRGMLQQLQRDADDCFDWTPPGGGRSVSQMVEQSRMFLTSLMRIPALRAAVVSAHGEVMLAISLAIEQLTPLRFNALCRQRAFDAPDGVIMHFTRRNPGTGEVAESYQWKRRECPWKPQDSSVEEHWMLLARPPE